MREQIGNWQQRLNQAWMVRVENWKRNQSHYKSQLEMLNPQRTLERGYAVILTQDKDDEKGMLQAVRNPKELKANASYQVRLAEGEAEIELSKISPWKINEPQIAKYGSFIEPY